MVARITPVEVISAVSRRRREGTVTSRTARAIRLLLDRHCAREYIIVELTPDIAVRAAGLLERHPLRAYDALQLATVLESNTRITAAQLPALTFISADNRLLAIAST